MPTNNKNEKKQFCYSIRKNIKTSKKLSQMGQNVQEKKYTLQQYSQILPKEKALPEEAFIYTADVTAMKMALKEIYKREKKYW